MAEILAMKRETADELVSADVKDGILRLTFTSPPANALSLALMAALQDAFDRARDDKSVHVIVLAAGGKLFSAGHDLKEMTARRSDADRGRAFFERTMTACSTLMQAIVNHPKPVIAEVDGPAFAAGCQLVASCDLAIASHEATFNTPGVNIGLFCSTPMVALSRNVSRKQAMEMLLTGDLIPAARAREIGLVNRVVPLEQLDEEVTALARQIAGKSPLTLAIGKEAFHRQIDMDLAAAYAYASEVMTTNMAARDAEEGIDAFLEKRQPSWQGS